MSPHGKLAAGGLAIAAAVAAAILAAGLWPTTPDQCRQVEIAIMQDGVPVYALATVRGPAPDGGDVAADLGAVAILDVREVECDGTTEPMSIAVEPVPWPCACRPVADTAGACLLDGQPAPFGRYLPAGQWSGPCARTPCVELAGVPALAPECSPPVAESEPPAP